MLLKSQWQISAPLQNPMSPTATQHGERWVVFAGGGAERDHLYRQWSADVEQHIQGARCVVLKPAGGGLEKRFTECAVQLLGVIQGVLSSRPQHSVLIQLVIGAERDENNVLRGLGALLKTAQMENPKLIGQVIEMEEAEPAQALVERLEWDATRADQREIRYLDGQRWVAGLREVEA